MQSCLVCIKSHRIKYDLNPSGISWYIPRKICTCNLCTVHYEWLSSSQTGSDAILKIVQFNSQRRKQHPSFYNFYLEQYLIKILIYMWVCPLTSLWPWPQTYTGTRCITTPNFCVNTKQFSMNNMTDTHWQTHTDTRTYRHRSFCYL